MFWLLPKPQECLVCCQIGTRQCLKASGMFGLLPNPHSAVCRSLRNVWFAGIASRMHHLCQMFTFILGNVWFPVNVYLAMFDFLPSFQQCLIFCWSLSSAQLAVKLSLNIVWYAASFSLCNISFAVNFYLTMLDLLPLDILRNIRFAPNPNLAVFDLLRNPHSAMFDLLPNLRIVWDLPPKPQQCLTCCQSRVKVWFVSEVSRM